MKRWWVVGCALYLAALVLVIAMQAAARDYFPPAVSISQYGIGPNGWIFSLFVITIAFTPVCFYASRPLPGYGIRTMMALGTAGAVVMALVRTDVGGAQHSWHAKVHMAGAILALALLPIVTLLTLRRHPPRWRNAAAVVVAGIGVCLIMVLISATGADTTGLGGPRSWALWQSIAVVLDIALSGIQVVAMRPAPAGPPPLARRGRWTASRH